MTRTLLTPCFYVTWPVWVTTIIIVMQGIIDADRAIKGALGLVVPFDAEVPNVAPGAEQGQSAHAMHNGAGQAPMPQ